MSGSVLTTWGSVAIAVYAGLIGATHFWFFVLVPIVSLLSQLLRAIIRQMTIGSLLKDDSAKLKLAMLADILFFWLWSIMLWTLIVSTVFGRTIRWRGIRYKMLSSAETIVLRD
jgi:hypothetical protein